MLKRCFFLTVVILMNCMLLWGQNAAKKPSLMILPSDNWCTMRYYTQTIDNQGTRTVMTDYGRAFREDIELGPVISKVGGVLSEKGFVVKDAEQAAKNLQTRTAENSLTESRSGDVLAESDLDIIKNQVKSDILIQIYWHIIKQDGGRAVQFVIEAFDCYNDTRIPATMEGIGKVSNDAIPVLIEKEVRKSIDAFANNLQKYYDDIAANGRAIKVNIRRWSGWEYDLDSEFEDEPLIDIIETWISENTLQGSFNLTGSTENVATFEQVRIPAFNEKGRAMDARGFGSQFRVFMKNEYQIPCKVLNRGLGEVTIVLGEQ